MNSAGAAQTGSQRPRVANYPPALYSEADEVIELYEQHVGRRLDIWQRFVLRHGLGRREDGEWAAWKIGCWVPRQNGKGDIILALELSWMFLPGFAVPLVTHSAHLYPTAQEAFMRAKDVIEGSDTLSGKLKGAPRESHGEQGFTLKSGQRLRFMARSRTGGRGFSAPRVVLDEAQELQPLMMAAALPTMSAQPDPQCWMFGTPPDTGDAWCYALKADGEAGAEDVSWFDWGRAINLDDEEDRKRVYDMSEAYAANPALGVRITERFLRGEMLPSGLGPLYPYEHLGVWRPQATAGAGVIADELWRDQKFTADERPARVALAAAVNFARTWGAIVSVGALADGRFLVEVLDHDRGVDWIPERMAQRRARLNPVGIGLDLKGPAGSLLLDFQRLGMDVPTDPDAPCSGDLACPTAQDTATGYGMFVDTTRKRGIVHLDEAPLNSALATARTRALAGATAWERKGVDDMSTLDAATLALWAYVTRADKVTDADYDLLDSVF